MMSENAKPNKIERTKIIMLKIHLKPKAFAELKSWAFEAAGVALFALLVWAALLVL